MPRHIAHRETYTFIHKNTHSHDYTHAMRIFKYYQVICLHARMHVHIRTLCKHGCACNLKKLLNNNNLNTFKIYSISSYLICIRI